MSQKILSGWLLKRDSLTRLIKVMRRVQSMVQASKVRYRKDGFDLDLSYVTPSCIAMSLPAVGAEATYRNPIEEVHRFFNSKHQDTYLIFNLCMERPYSSSYFGGRVQKVDVEDHNPPTLGQIVAFLEKANEFISEDFHRVIAVHW